jgi:hypothetical protein
MGHSLLPRQPRGLERSSVRRPYPIIIALHRLMSVIPFGAVGLLYYKSNNI